MHLICPDLLCPGLSLVPYPLLTLLDLDKDIRYVLDANSYPLIRWSPCLICYALLNIMYV